MLFFKKQKEKTDYYKSLSDEISNRINDLDVKFKKGMKFQYLGVDCVVTHTFEYYNDYVYMGYALGIMPTISVRAVLKADYVDKNGVIRRLSLSYDEAMRIGH